MVSLLYLLGTCHWDLKGAQRQRKFFSYVRPQTILLEASQEVISLRRKERKAIKAELQEQEQFNKTMEKLYASIGQIEPELDEQQIALDFMIAQGYEIWSSYEYKEEENSTATIIPIHDHAILEDGVSLYQQALGPDNVDAKGNFTTTFYDNLNTNSKDTFQEWVDSMYFAQEKTLEEFANDPNFFKRVQEMDDAMESGIRAQLDKGLEGTTVIVAGANHFFTPYKNNLYERLKEYSPVPVRLIDVDQF